MKTLLLPMILSAAVAFGAIDNPEKKKVAAVASVSVEQQLARQLTYPAALQVSWKGSAVVVVQFQLNETNRLIHLRVFCDNQQLTDELTQQLLSARVKPAEPVEYVARTYTARLHFKR
jgi:hypothetical protein